MDLFSLANAVKEYFNPGYSAITTEPGQTYGPAQARLSHVPINFLPGPSRESGVTYTSTGGWPAVHGPMGDVSMGHPQDSHINIYPNSPDIQQNYGGNVNDAIKHEIGHSIMEPVGDNTLENVASKNPALEPVQNALYNHNRAIVPIHSEAPAYMAESQAASRYGVPSAIRQQYLQSQVQNLAKTDPVRASQYARLVHLATTPPPITMETKPASNAGVAQN